jgi:hypothetical protein
VFGSGTVSPITLFNVDSRVLLLPDVNNVSSQIDGLFDLLMSGTVSPTTPQCFVYPRLLWAAEVEFFFYCLIPEMRLHGYIFNEAIASRDYRNMKRCAEIISLLSDEV